MVDTIFWIAGVFLLFVLAYRAAETYKGMSANQSTTAEENERARIKAQVHKITMYVDIFLEEIDNQWYGWTVSTNGQEHFVAQGTTRDEAKQKCADRLMEKNNGVIYVIKFLKR